MIMVCGERVRWWRDADCEVHAGGAEDVPDHGHVRRAEAVDESIGGAQAISRRRAGTGAGSRARRVTKPWVGAKLHVSTLRAAARGSIGGHAPEQFAVKKAVGGTRRHGVT